MLRKAKRDARGRIVGPSVKRPGIPRQRRMADSLKRSGFADPEIANIVAGLAESGQYWTSEFRVSAANRKRKVKELQEDLETSWGNAVDIYYEQLELKRRVTSLWDVLYET